MILQYLLDDMDIKKVEGKTDINISKIEYDSTKISKEDVFVAINGYEKDGNDYIKEATQKGAVCIVLEESFEDEVKSKNSDILGGATLVFVENSRKALAEISSKYYGSPSKQLKIIGITGTKGKTTTAYMIRDIMLKAGKKIGMIGTILTSYGDKVIESDRTCPESLELNKIFRDMVDSGMEYVVMEVSSHALELYRVYGLHFIIAIFTNLSHEHLDFHKTMENYLNAKKKLFTMCDYALVNGDDIYTAQLIKGLECKVAKFGLDNEVNITSSDVRTYGGYVEFKMYINKMLETIRVNIPGKFTVYNALAAIGATSMLGCQMDSILLALMELKVPGRSEVVDIGKNFTVVVDYAHTPSSLEAILVSTKKYAKGRVICVFGCGGNRDVEKREEMGKIAGKYANFTIVTTDNPRDENPNKIMEQIEKGVKESNGLMTKIENRKDAIRFSMRIAWKNDIVIIAGKGHETYQILKNKKKIHFDDREVVRELAKEFPEKDLKEEVV